MCCLNVKFKSNEHIPYLQVSRLQITLNSTIARSLELKGASTLVLKTKLLSLIKTKSNIEPLRVVLEYPLS